MHADVDWKAVANIISGRCDSFRMPGANADLALPLPALCDWLEENDLAVSSYARRRRGSGRSAEQGHGIRM